MDAYTHTLSLLPGVADRHTLQGEFLKAAAAFTKALKALDAETGSDVVELKATVLSNRSAAFAKLNKARQALSDAEQAFALRPTWDKASFRRGIALEVRERLRVRHTWTLTDEQTCSSQLMDRHDEAVEAYTRAAELGSDGKPNAEVVNRLRALKVTMKGGGVNSASSSSLFVFKNKSSVPEERDSPAGETSAEWLVAEAAAQLSRRLEESFGSSSDVCGSLDSATRGAMDAPSLCVAVATACVHRKGADAAAWQLLAPDGALFAAVKPHHRAACARALETFRREHTPGENMPLPRDPTALVLAARCEPEAAAIRRAALEACNAAFLAAVRTCGSNQYNGPALFDLAVVAQLMKAGLADACLEGVSPTQPLVVREAAAGTFHNLVHHARRQSQARASSTGGADDAATAAAAHERLAQLLDRPDNPLDDDASAGDGDAADASAAEAWDAAAAHAFFVPVAALLSEPPVQQHLLSPLSLQLLRCNALDVAEQVLRQRQQQKQQGAANEASSMLQGVVTVLVLLERVAVLGCVPFPNRTSFLL